MFNHVPFIEHFFQHKVACYFRTNVHIRVQGSITMSSNGIQLHINFQKENPKQREITTSQILPFRFPKATLPPYLVSPKMSISSKLLLSHIPI